MKKVWLWIKAEPIKIALWASDLGSDLTLFFAGWIKYIFYHTVFTFRKVEVVKSNIAEKLYQGRGRMAKPFIHTGMGGLFLLGLLIAPIISKSFPSISNRSLAQMDNSPIVLSASIIDDSMDTTISEKPRSEVYEYTVAVGDTISGIAQKFQVSIDTIRWANSLDTISSIKPGQVLKIPPVTGIIHKVKKGETISSIAKYYQTESQGIVDYPFNSFVDDESFALAVGQTVVIPDGIMPKVQLWSPSSSIAKQTPNAGTVTALGQFIWPTSGRISQGFRWYHRAIDIANKTGTPILAADAGKVIVAGWPDNVGYGNRVVIDHNNGTMTLYGHLSKVAVSAGQTVNRGDVIGSMGSTGRSTGSHLHFEIRVGGKTTDPMGYLK